MPKRRYHSIRGVMNKMPAWHARQAESRRLSNAELAAAIEEAQRQLRGTGTGSPVYESISEHVKSLLEIQRKRASV